MTTALGGVGAGFPVATIDVTVRFQRAHEPAVDVELGVHDRAEALRVTRHLAGSRGGHVEGPTADEDTTAGVLLVVPPGHTDTDPHAVERIQRIAAIRTTLLATEPGTVDYHTLACELWCTEPVAHRAPPRAASTDQHVATTDGSAS